VGVRRRGCSDLDDVAAMNNAPTSAPRSPIRHDSPVRTVRNVAIIALLALMLTVLPAGGNVAEGILVFLSLLFAVAIAGMLVRLWKDTALHRDAMTDRQRWLVYGSSGAIALMIAGADEMLASGPGTVAWIVILVAAGWLIFNTWRESQSI
jgi:hypothetical protein